MPISKDEKADLVNLHERLMQTNKELLLAEQANKVAQYNFNIFVLKLEEKPK